MASFSSSDSRRRAPGAPGQGICVSLLEEQWNARHEERMRRQGIDPNDKTWRGATLSRRQHKAPQRDKAAEKDREEADALPQELGLIAPREPEYRLKWLQRALLCASKKQIQASVIYDIVTSTRFITNADARIGARMHDLIMSNLHLFSQKQQTALQSDTSQFKAFSSEPAARSSTSGARNSRGRDSDDDDSYSLSPSPLPARKTQAATKSKTRGRPADARKAAESAEDDSDSLDSQAVADEKKKGTSGGSSRKRARDPVDVGRTNDDEGSKDDALVKPAAPKMKMKMSISSWQPVCVREVLGKP